ncbi:hypothetical protein D3C85_1910980 [compost metagenome]
MGIYPGTPVVGCAVDLKLQRFQASSAFIGIVVSVDGQPVRTHRCIVFIDQQLIRPPAGQLFFE